MSDREEDTDALVERAGSGDPQAAQQLFARHRDRLRRMVAVRMDPRIAARLDPSDVVQEALMEASRRLTEYCARRPLPFYPWLRRLAWERLVQLHRQHIRSRKRSVVREQPAEVVLPDESVAALADRLVSGQSSPSARLVRREMLNRVQAALHALSPDDREILVPRYLEQLSTEEAAAVLGMSIAAAKTRHFRAIHRLHRRLAQSPEESGP